MMSSKIKQGGNGGAPAPSSKGKVTGLPSTGQTIKMATSSGLQVGAAQPNGQNVTTTGANLQHPSHAKKLSEGKMTGSKAGLGQHKFNNTNGNATQPISMNLNMDMQKKAAFEISRN